MSIVDTIVFGLGALAILGTATYTFIHLTRVARRLKDEINKQ